MSTRKPIQMDQAALIRSMAVKSPCDFMWLLGAGASVTSGIKTASQCTWTWKRQLFLTAHPTVAPDLLSDITDRRVQQRIQHWLDSLPGTPPLHDPGEYAHFVERCYPRAEDRRRYFEGVVRVGRPGPGYRLLGRLVEQGHFRWFWTTNFDDMLARSVPQDCPRPLRRYGMDTLSRLRSAAERDDYVNVVHLHGDYRYDTLRNTSDELRALDAEYASELSRLGVELPLLVVGYSGCDESVMSALEATYSRPGRGAIYWLVVAGSEPSPRVRSLVEIAARNGHDAAVVVIDGFDDFLRRAAQLLLPKEQVAQLVDEERKRAQESRPRFQHHDYPGRSGVAKSNTWSLVVPPTYWACAAPHIDSWAKLRELAGAVPLSAGLLGGRIVALGARADVARLASAPETAVEDAEFTSFDLKEDSVLHGVLCDYVARSLAGSKWSLARRRGRQVLFHRNESSPLQGFPGFRWCPAAELGIHFDGRGAVLTVVPDRHVFADDPGVSVPAEAWWAVNTELSRQWNKKFNDEFNRWRDGLGLKSADLPLALGVGPSTSVVLVERGPRFATILSPNIADRHNPGIPADYLKLSAFNLREPVLRFGGGQDVHPLRGLLEHGPAELRLPRLAEQDLRLGVVSPESARGDVDAILNELVAGHQRVETREDYQEPYPGFEAVFRMRLRLGTAGGGGRVHLPVDLTDGAPVDQQREALERVCAGIDRAAAASASVVLIVFPEAWEHLAEVEDGDRRLDFHDLVKAHAAPQGIATQVVRQRTAHKGQRLEVLWWLALALYAKAKRVPWMLDSTAGGTVHVGVGYGLDPGNRSRPVVMCCSHIYQSSGLGLRFQLSEVGSPIFLGRRKNPYLSRDDAYRVGAKALQAVVESSEAPPRRVCISKRTPFTDDERAGFLAALADVPEVELLSVEIDDGVRLIRADKAGGDPAAFPMPRGTVVPYGDHEALVWVHGDVPGVSSKFGGAHYYQGKSRIPAPLRVTRYAGAASLEELGSDLLSLSKMDWNSLDLYGKIPVQLTSPARIARVAKLLGNVQLEDRDYRLFM